MRFTIWTPLPESAPHAGVKALWRLGRELVARGHELTMWLGGPLPECDRLILPERTAPLAGHPHTVRWVLLHGGQHRDGERVYTWSPAYIDAPMLRVPAFDLDELKDTGQERHGTAVWVGKGRADRYLPTDARLITYDLPRPAVVEILRTSTSLLSFDAFTAVNTEATLCGTPVTIPLPRPPDMPEDDDYGFKWADVDHSARVVEARRMVEEANLRAAYLIDDFVEDMHAWT